MSRHLLSRLAVLSVIAISSFQATNASSNPLADGWYQYQVPLAENTGSPCCQVDGASRTCTLASSPQNLHIDKSLSSETLVIYFKQNAQAVEDIVLAGQQCQVDTGTSPVKRLTNWSVAQSLEMLQSLSSGSDHHLATMAIAAIALHRDTEATEALVNIAFDAQHEDQRDAIFWLGEARQRDGYAHLRRLIDTESLSVKTRKHAVFALSLSTHPAALDTLSALARGYPTAQIQKEAIFWYAEHKGHNPTPLLLDLTGPAYPRSIQKEAVFGLSRLPGSLATDALTTLVRDTQSRTVRESAMFWLGQSKDPKAFKFLTEILTK